MFGHDNDDQNQTQDNQNQTSAAMVAPTPDGSLDATHTQQITSDNDQNDQSAGAPPTNDSAGEYEATPVSTVQDDGAASQAKDEDGDNDDLIDIKQQALQQLSPLVGHLDQTPEEKFKTTMMMIQASDDKTLVKTAYEAALAINNEKTRAQALLDVINEINYFTHPNNE